MTSDLLFRENIRSLSPNFNPYYIESDDPCALAGFDYAARGYLPA